MSKKAMHGVAWSCLVIFVATCHVAEAEDDNSPLFPIDMGTAIEPRYGFISQDGRTMISPQFLWTMGFSEELACVRTADGWGFIDREGDLVIPARFKHTYSFSEGLGRVALGKKEGYVDKSGKFAIEPHFDKAWDFAEGMALVCVGSDYAFIDRHGETRFRLPASCQVISSGFSEGMLVVACEVASRSMTSMPSTKGKLGYMDTAGNVVIHPSFDNAGPFREGLAGVRKDGRFFYIDRRGETILQADWEGGSYFSEGLAVVRRKGGLCGYVDKHGNTAIPFQYDEAFPFCDGLARVLITERHWLRKSVSRYGYIDRTGRVVIKPQFDSADDFRNGLALVEKEGRKMYIDKAGQTVWVYEKKGLSK